MVGILGAHGADGLGHTGRLRKEQLARWPRRPAHASNLGASGARKRPSRTERVFDPWRDESRVGGMYRPNRSDEIFHGTHFRLWPGFGAHSEITMGERIEKPWLFFQWLWDCRYCWYALAFMPSVMVLFSIFEIIKFLEYSRDYSLDWRKYGWAFAAKSLYVFSMIT